MLIGDGCVAHPGNCYEQSDQVRIWPCCHSAALSTAWSGNQDEKMLGHPPKVRAKAAAVAMALSCPLPGHYTRAGEARGDECDQDQRVWTLTLLCFVSAQEVDVIRSCQERMQRFLDRAKAQLA